MVFSAEEEHIPSQPDSKEQVLISSPQDSFPPGLRWQIIEQSRDCIKLLDLEGRLLYMNRGGQQCMEIEDFSTCWLADWLSFWSGDGLQAARAALALARQGEESMFEGEAQTAKGTPRWWEVSVCPVRNVEGRVTHILASSRDSTERERAQRAFAAQARLGSLNLAVSVALTQHTDVQQMLRCCTQALVDHLDAAFARIWILNEAQAMLELQASSGLYTHLEGGYSRVPLGAFRVGRIALSREPQLTNHILGDTQVPEQAWAKREGIVSFAGYPLLVEEKVVGVIALFARQPLSTAVLDALASIANAVALGIERKRAEEERVRLLRETQEAAAQAEHERARLTAVLENLTDAFMIFDEHWRYTYINPQAAPYIDTPWQNLLGKNIWDVSPTLVGSLYDQYYHQAMERQEPVAFEVFNQARAAWFEIHAYPIPGGLAVSFRNISERKQAEMERVRLWVEAERARREAEDALEGRTAFLSSVSHDLKTPLTVMKGTLQMLQHRLKQAFLDASWVQERLKIIEAAISKMHGMVEDVLIIAQTNAGQHLDLNLRYLDLFPIVARIVSEQQETTQCHHLQLTSFSETLPVHGDAIRLDRVVTNLLTNAIKYSPAGGSITLDIAAEQEDQHSWIALRFQDEGVGIPEADLPLLFDPFYRATNVRGQIPGTGVGLASVAQVVREHGGTISITSQVGQGSCILVRLPASVTHASAHENAHL